MFGTCYNKLCYDNLRIIILKLGYEVVLFNIMIPYLECDNLVREQYVLKIIPIVTLQTKLSYSTGYLYKTCLL